MNDQLNARLELGAAIASLPDEAIGWLLGQLAGSTGRGQVWPDGLGGFREESRAGIARVQRAADVLLKMLAG